MKRLTSALRVLSFLLPCLALVVIAMKFFGQHRWIAALTLCLCGTVCLFMAFRLNVRARQRVAAREGRVVDAMKRNKRFLVAAVALTLLAYLAILLFPADKTDFLKANRQGLEEQVNSDFAMIPVYLQGMDDALAAIDGHKDLFQGDPSKYTAEQRLVLLQLWSRYLAYSMQLEQMKHVHRYFFQINYLKYPELNTRSFLIAYGAFAGGFEGALRITALVGNNEYMKTLLNEASPENDIPENTFLALSRAATDPGNVIRLHAGRANLRFLETAGRLTGESVSALARRGGTDYTKILHLLGDQPELFGQTSRDLFEKHVLTAWLPLQKGVAEGMSLVRTTHRENFITLKDLAEHGKKLEPGDILLERRNWYLTNIGIPGFWPHTALYTGSLKDLDEYFKGEMAAGSSVSAVVRSLDPELYSALAGRTPEGFEYRVLEAIGPGVIPTAFEKSGRADYLAVLRPRLDKQEKLKALFKAFSYYRKPYDYNFDFITDSALVCSELVYKSYRPGNSKKGVAFQLVETAGRLLLPPNHIVRKFDLEFGKDDAELDFVLFLDGSEADHRAFSRDAEAFRRSHGRPKWDVAQQ